MVAVPSAAAGTTNEMRRNPLLEQSHGLTGLSSSSTSHFTCFGSSTCKNRRLPFCASTRRFPSPDSTVPEATICQRSGVPGATPEKSSRTVAARVARSSVKVRLADFTQGP